jgi:cathepsin B
MESCYPYVCGDYGYETMCPTECIDPTLPFAHFQCAKHSESYPVKVNDIKKEIFNNGPVESGMLVYADFLNYESGIYEYVTGDYVGGHAIKIIGWGKHTEEDGDVVDYWLCANSWGTDWGEDGYFKIKMG